MKNVNPFWKRNIPTWSKLLNDLTEADQRKSIDTTWEYLLGDNLLRMIKEWIQVIY